MPKNNRKSGSSFLAKPPPIQSYSWALQIMGLAAAYFVTGKLGTFLAIPPGYATAIWPPSGIALAGILLYGYRIWPGILLGSFLVNLSTSLITGTPAETLISVTITLVIGGGACMQAVAGAYLVRRFAGFPNPLVREKEVFLLFFFGGILSTLVNSTIAVSTLVAAARMPVENSLTNWATWWMGDALGIFIFTPLALAWAQRSNEGWRNRQLAITLPVVVLFILTTTIVFYEAQNNNDRLKRQFSLQASELDAALEKSVLIYLNVLRSLGSFYSASESVDRNKFRIFVEHSLNNFNGIQAISWNPRILLSERDAYERGIQNEGFQNFQIIEKNSDNRIVRAADRHLYVPVGFVEPFQGNEKALGFDVYSDPVRQEALDRATDTGEIAATAPVILVQEHENRPGILAYLPVYRKGSPYQTLEQRRDNITGYVTAVFRGEDIITSALKDANQEGLAYKVIDEGAASKDQLIFSNSREPLKPLVLQENGLFGRNFSLISSLTIPVGGRLWRIDVVPTQHYLAFHKSNNAWLILLGGLLLTSMVSSFVLVFSGRGNMLRRLVDERTAALAQSEERFRSTFESAPVGVVNSSLNGGFLAVNQSYCDLLGYSRDELLTMTFRQVTHPDYRQYDADMIKRMLADEISAFTVEKKYLRKDGTVVWGNLSVKLLRHPDGSPHQFVAVIENIDRRKQAEAQIAKSLSLLSATLESSNDAILVVDMNNAWVLHNQRFIDLWHITDEIIKAKDDGAALSYVLDQLEDAVSFLSKVYELYATPEASSFDILKFKNGQIIERYSIPQYIDGIVVGRVWSFRDITERRLAEQSLQRENEKNLALLHNASDGIHILDTVGNTIEVSDSFCAMLGYQRDEMIGMNVTQWEAQSAPDECLQIVRQQFTKQSRSLFETRHRRKDGTIIDVEVSGYPLELDGNQVLFNSSRDITDRKLAEQKLSAQNLRYQTLLKSSTDGIHIIDLDGNIVDVNEAFCRQLDYSYKEAMQLNITQWNAEWSAEEVLRLLNELIHSGQAKQFETKHRRKDGSIIDVEINSVQVVVEGQPLLFASARDITGRKQNEAVILLAKERAEALAQSKSAFLANMSHEIRTPMNAIIGLSHLALNKPVSAEIRDYLEKISSSSNNLLSILNDILDFSKLEAGRLMIEHSPFDLDEILDNLHSLFADRAQEKHLDFNIAVAPEVPRGLVGDTLRLQQVLINLLGNAIKFTEHGQVTLTITTQQISPAQARLLFCVTDTGIGLSDDDLKKLFQPFSQVDGSITRRFGGTGLGLAISHNLLQLMGSEFAVTSAHGQGSSFSFELVLGLSPLSGRQQIEHKSGSSVPTQENFGKFPAATRILVAEDNLINQQVVREFLNLYKITVEVASNGKEAMALLEQNVFDAVLMDIHMPEMDGFEATKLIRSQGRFAELPVIALTAGVTKEERERCIASGMNDFIAKPINPEKLIRTLTKWLKPVDAAATDTFAAEPRLTGLLNAAGLPGFDLHNLLEMIGNNQELAIQLLFTFMDNMKDLADEIETLATAGNLVSAKEKIHKLKGAAGTVGAMRLHAASEALEGELNDRLPAAAFDRFREAFEQTMSAIAALHQSVDSMPPTCGNSEALKHAAAELDLKLKENDFISEALLNTLKPHLRLDQLDLFAQLRKQINELQYDEASKSLRQLAEWADMQET